MGAEGFHVEGGVSHNGGEEFGEVTELNGYISNLNDGVGHAWGDCIEFIIKMVGSLALDGVAGGLRRFPLISIHLESCA